MVVISHTRTSEEAFEKGNRKILKSKISNSLEKKHSRYGAREKDKHVNLKLSKVQTLHEALEVEQFYD